MVKGKTASGYEVVFDPAAMDDMRLVELIATVDNPATPPFEGVAAVSGICSLLLGADGKKALYEHVGKSHGGRVPMAALQAEIVDIMALAGKDAEKNS